MEEGDDELGGDRRESFNRDEAAADDSFFGEEDDEYDDLYNDVNVGEGFLQSMQRDDVSPGLKTDAKQEEKRTDNPVGVETVGQVALATSVPIPPGAFPEDGRVEKDPLPPIDGGIKVYPGSQYHMNEGTQIVPHQTGQVGGLRIDMSQPPVRSPADVGAQMDNRMQSNPVTNENYGRPPGVPPNGDSTNVANVNGFGSGSGGTVLFIGELHWWTTDADLESELSKYGQVKEVKFFDEKASGKSKGYCQAEFYDSGATEACKNGMNGHLFNGRACVVAFASPFSVRKMGEALVNKNQPMSQTNSQQGGRQGQGQGPGDMGGNGRGSAISTGANYQGGDQGRNFGRGNWGRGGRGMANRGQMGPMRNRMGMGGRGLMGNNGSGFGQGMSTSNPSMVHPQGMMGQGFDPSFAAMGRMNGYGGFPGGPTPPFPGMMPSFPPVGGMLPGVAPHVNPAFFGRGMAGNGMGMMNVSGVDGFGMGMWSDPNMTGWGGEEQGGRAGESSYGEDATSEHQYEANHERSGWQNPPKDKDKTSERDLPSTGDRSYRDGKELGYDKGEREEDPSHGWTNRRHDDREKEWSHGRDRDRDRVREREPRDRERVRERERDRGRDDRDLYREERDRQLDHRRHKDRDLDYDDGWEDRRSSKNRSRSRMSLEEDQYQRSREAEHGKRRRLPSE